MTPLTKIISAVNGHPGGVDAVATESGIPVDTLIKIVKGYTKNPRLDTFSRLDKWHRGTFGGKSAQ
jgi:predicted transcriptional regulator